MTKFLGKTCVVGSGAAGKFCHLIIRDFIAHTRTLFIIRSLGDRITRALIEYKCLVWKHHILTWVSLMKRWTVARECRKLSVLLFSDKLFFYTNLYHFKIFKIVLKMFKTGLAERNSVMYAILWYTLSKVFACEIAQ